MKKALLSAACLLVAVSAALPKQSWRAGKDSALQEGLVRMETVSASGAVLFYVVNGKKIYPAVEPSGYGESSYISLYDGTREYRLNKNGSCKYYFESDEKSLTEVFTVKGVAELRAVYTLSKKDSKDEIINSVEVKYSLKSLLGKEKPLALKAVYNLRLGENRKAHYSSALKNEISSEYVINPSAEDSWIISSDSQNAVEFILCGAGVTAPQRAAVANKETIERATPSADFTPGNSFDSLLSYNNSSLALFWPPVALGENDTANYAYKINFSISDFQNSGKKAAEVPKAEKQEEEKKDVPLPEPEKKSDDALASELDSVDPSKLNAEYVQQLINHINSLEQSDPSLNKIKIQQLQTEVDEVLQVLRSRK